ncbi:MAG: triose-phosphate isomerase, partial [Chloroflexi bacterium]|nr:triose-phosphate isomerase [Chloroflexota bacterium]
MRKPLVVGNWKMNTLREEAQTLARALVASLSDVQSTEMIVAPPFPWLTDVAGIVQGSPVQLAAQNMHTEVGGAYTGEVSPRMLKGICQYVLVGQYERRILFGDKEAIVRRKVASAQEQGVIPILCVGEDADQLDEGLGFFVVAEQVEADLEGARIDDKLVIAYEPSWTTMGRVAPPPISYVVDIVGHIRDTLTMLYSQTLADQTRVIYGGQVNPRNIEEIAAEASIDGVLASTASTNAANFTTL